MFQPMDASPTFIWKRSVWPVVSFTAPPVELFEVARASPDVTLFADADCTVVVNIEGVRRLTLKVI